MSTTIIRSSRRGPLWHYVLPWILMLPMLVFAGSGQFSFQTGARNVAVGDAADVGQQVRGEREVLIFTYLILIVAIATRYKQVAETAVGMTAVTGLAILPILSTLWSQYPEISLVRGGYYLVDTLFVYYLLREFSAEELRSLVMMVGSAVAIGCITTVVLLPQYGIVNQIAHAGAWQGIFSEKNAAGKCLVFLLTPVVSFSRKLRLSALIYGGTIFTLIAMSKSRTAWVVTVAYICFMFSLYIARRLDGRLLLLLSSLCAMTTIVTAALVVSNISSVLHMLNRDATLSGRTDVWREVVHAIATHPLLGYGFQAFWNGLNGESAKIIIALQWNFGYAHDGFLEVLLQLGVVGLAVIGYILFKAIKDAWFCFRHSTDSGTEWYIGLIFLTLLYNLDEETLLFPHQLVTVLFLLACGGLVISKKEAIFAAGSISYQKLRWTRKFQTEVDWIAPRSELNPGRSIVLESLYKQK